jgi:hypothetical protein
MNLLKHLTFTLIGLVLAIQSSSIFAVEYAQYYDRLSKVQVGQDSYILINVVGNFSSAHGCSRPFFARSENTLNSPKSTALFDLARTAFETKQCVYVTTDGCTSGGYPILVQLQLEERDPTTGRCPGSTSQPPGSSQRPCSIEQKCCGAIVNGICNGQCVSDVLPCP